MEKLNKEDIEELQEFFREMEEKIDESGSDDKGLGIWLRKKWRGYSFSFRYKNIFERMQNESGN